MPLNPLTLLTGKAVTWITVAAFVALSAFTVKLKLDNSGLSLEISKQKTELANARTKAADERTQLIAAHRAKEGQLVSQLINDQEAANATINDLSARATALAASLRDAKRARTTAAAVPSTTPDTSAQQAASSPDRPLVPAEIGESDVAEALRADTIRVELLRCYAAYDRAEQTLRSLIDKPQTESFPMSKITPVEHLLSLGAESVGGDLMYGRKVLGTNRNGVFVLTEEGEKMMGVEEAVVVVKAAAPVAEAQVKTPAAKKTAKDKSRDAGNVPAADATPVVAPEVVAAAPQVADLDSLLGE